MSASPRTAVAARRVIEFRRFVVAVVAVALAAALLVVPRQSAQAATPRLTTAVTATYARAMLALLNQERKAHNRRPLRMNSKLITSAHRHNLRMAALNTMSHQLPGEPFFATRISNAGYQWSAAGENIGWNSNLSQSGLMALEREMYHEVPPNDGHRVNILSSTFRQVGIDVYFDAKHKKIWFTQDFGAPA